MYGLQHGLGTRNDDTVLAIHFYPEKRVGGALWKVSEKMGTKFRFFSRWYEGSTTVV